VNLERCRKDAKALARAFRAIADELIVNISRNGTVSLPVSRGGPGYDAIVRGIAEASVVLHEELLELD
jgi:hypothetical protein